MKEVTENTPLEGLRVLDVGTTIAGPMAATLLGDFGAEVVKIEHPQKGDPMREWPPIKDGKSLWWKVISRNKKLITLDLSTKKGRTLLLRLAEHTDVLIENFRPGTMERWGVGYKDLCEVNPSIIMVRISGYGQDGPYKDRPGYGTIAEAMSGLPGFTGFPDKPPTFSAFPLADTVASMFSVMDAMFALYHRDRQEKNQGQEIDVSLYEPLLRLLESLVIGFDQLGIVKERIGNRMQEAAPRNIYETLDKEWVAISASSQRTFTRLAEAIGQPELSSSPKFGDNPQRVINSDELDSILQEWFGAHDLDTVLMTLRKYDVVSGPVYDLFRIFEDHHYKAREAIIEVDDPDFGRVKMQNAVPKFSKTPGRVKFPGLGRGFHNNEIYGDLLKLSQEEIAELKDMSVI